MVCLHGKSTTGNCLVRAATASASTPCATPDCGSMALGCLVPRSSTCGSPMRIDCSRLHVHATVDTPHLSGDVGGGIGGQEVDDPSDFLGPAGAANGNLAG